MAKANKTPSEKETRENLIGHAKKVGCFEDLMKIFARYDEWISHARTEEERKALQVMGVREVEVLFGKTQGLLLNYIPIEEYGKK